MADRTPLDISENPKCPNCIFKVGSLEDYALHDAWHSGLVGELIQCTVKLVPSKLECCCTFKSMIDLEYHVENYHGFPLEIKARGRSWPHRTLPRLLPGELLQTRGGGIPSVVTVKEPNSSAKSAAKVKSTPTAACAPRRALKTAATTSSAKRQPLSVQFNRFSEQKGLTSRKRVSIPTKLFDGEKPADELDDDVDEKPTDEQLHDVVAENALSHNDLVTVVEESHNSLTASFLETETTTTTAAADLPAAEENNNLLHSVVGTNTADDCRTPSSVSLKEPSNPATATTASSSVVVKSAPIVPRRALKTAAKTTGLTSRQLPPNVQFSCFSEQKGVTSRKRACFSTNLFDGEKLTDELDEAVGEKAENALSHNDNHNKLIIWPSLNATEKVLEENAEYALRYDDLIPSEFLSITLEESHIGMTESFFETATASGTTTTATAAALPVVAEKENSSPFHLVMGASLKVNTSDSAHCRTPSSVSLKEPFNPATASSASSAVVVKSTPIVPRCALKTTSTTSSASRQPPNVQFNRFSEQKGMMMTSRKQVCFSTKLFDGEKPTDKLDEKAENALSDNDNNSKLIIRPSLNATVLVNEKVLEENAETALSHNDRVSNEGLSTTLEESHIGMTESFFETATASGTTTTATAAADLPAEEEKKKNSSPFHSVVGTNTFTDCRTPSSVSLKKPNSNPTTATAAASSSVVVISTPTAGLRCALKTSATTTSSSSAKRQPLSVQMTSRKRVCVPTKLFDWEKPTDEQLDEKAESAENAQISHDDLMPSEGLSFTGEESRIGMTESFIEKVTAAEITTASAALPVAEEENNSLPHSVVETSLETPSTTADCRTPTLATKKAVELQIDGPLDDEDDDFSDMLLLQAARKRAHTKRIVKFLDDDDEKEEVRKKKFLCTVSGCDKQYRTIYSLRRHLREHNEPEGYPCTVAGCSGVFKRKDGFHRHMRNVHDINNTAGGGGGKLDDIDIANIQIPTKLKQKKAGKQIPCTVPNCPYFCKDLFHLQRHLKAHKNVRPYGCKFCSSVFGRREHAIRHILSRHLDDGNPRKNGKKPDPKVYLTVKKELL